MTVKNKIRLWECHETPYARILHEGAAEYCGERCKDDEHTVDMFAISATAANRILELASVIASCGQTPECSRTDAEHIISILTGVEYD